MSGPQPESTEPIGSPMRLAMHDAFNRALNAILDGEPLVAFEEFCRAHDFALAMSDWHFAIAIEDAVIELAQRCATSVGAGRRVRLANFGVAGSGDTRDEDVARDEVRKLWRGRARTWRATRDHSLRRVEDQREINAFVAETQR